MLISSENNQVNNDNEGSELELIGDAYYITNYDISHICCITPRAVRMCRPHCVAGMSLCLHWLIKVCSKLVSLITLFYQFFYFNCINRCQFSLHVSSLFPVFCQGLPPLFLPLGL
jgi:hypothetical protein